MDFLDSYLFQYTLIFSTYLVDFCESGAWGKGDSIHGISGFACNLLDLVLGF